MQYIGLHVSALMIVRKFIYTVVCHYNAMQYNIRLHTENESDFEHTKDTPYLTLMSELWGVYCENFQENWPRYNGTAL